MKKLNAKNVTELSMQLGEKVNKIVDSARKRADKILKGYGLKTKMQVTIEKQDLQNME